MDSEGLNIEEPVSAFWYWPKQLPPKTCQQIINLGKEKWESAQVVDNVANVKINVLEKDIRNNDVAWINEQWIYDLVFPFMRDANEFAVWKYNIVSANDCQLTRYTKGTFYSWHKDGLGSHNDVDTNPDNKLLYGNTRKLSMTVVLNNDYEGGDFQIRGDYNIAKVPRLEEGSIIVFPSFMDHRVTPVTKGIRYSLVVWFVGPPFI